MMHRQVCMCLVLGAVLTAVGAANSAGQTRPLHERIDAAISAAHFGDSAKTATDAEFLRRIYVDLIGRSPTIEETKPFLANPDAHKRSALIDKLINSDELNDFFAAVLDIMLMERRADKHIPQAQWRAFLRDALAEKQPFDQIVRSILTADGTGDLRGAAKFLLARQVEPNALTRDVGRMFLGRDLQCAQCHDHPIVDDYLQAEYYGIYAFLNRSYLFEDQADKKKPYVGEKAEGHTEYKSVFFPEDGASQTMPRLLGGLTLDVEPRFEGEDAYVVAPSKKTAGLPKFSRRAQLARLVTHPSNQYFAKNFANRLWAHMFGRGIVEPVDFHHPDNPPSHPYLLQTLADEFVAMQFDIHEFVRQIALSDTYQRSVDFPAEPTVSLADIDAEFNNLSSAITELEATLEVDTQQTQYAARLQDARSKVSQIDQAISDVAKRLAETGKQQQDLESKRQDLEKQLGAKKQQLAALNNAVAAAQKAAAALPNDKSLATAHIEYKQRADKVKQEVEAVNKSLAESQEKSKSLAQQFASTKRELTNLKANRVGLVDMVAEARGAMSVFSDRRRKLESLLHEKRQRRVALATHRDYLAKSLSRQDLATRYAKLAAAPSVPDAAITDIETSVANADREVKAKQQLVEELSQNATAGDEVLTRKTAALDALQQAIAHAKSAAEQLTDPQLDSTIEDLAKKQVAFSEELTAAKNESRERHFELKQAQGALKTIVTDREKLVADHEALLARMAQHEQQLATTQAARDAAVVAEKLAREQLRTSWEHRFVVRALNPLTPEQLAGSTIAALGLEARFQREAEKERAKANKDKKPDEIDKARKQTEIAALITKRIAQVESTYISLFAAPGGAPQDVFSATADQALFLANDGRVQNWLSPSAGTLIERLQSIDDTNVLADELRLAILSRPATQSEKQVVAEYLAPRSADRHKAIQELVWGLLSSLEFRFNH